jgi:hypothetical protein
VGIAGGTGRETGTEMDSIAVSEGFVEDTKATLGIRRSVGRSSRKRGLRA